MGSSSVGYELSTALFLLGMTQTDLARAAGISHKHINQVIHGRARLTAEKAVEIEWVLMQRAQSYTGTVPLPELSAERWMELDVRRQVGEARLARVT